MYSNPLKSKPFQPMNSVFIGRKLNVVTSLCAYRRIVGKRQFLYEIVYATVNNLVHFISALFKYVNYLLRVNLVLEF